MRLNKTKIISLSLLFSTAFFSFTSCEKDENNDNTQQENQYTEESAAQGVTVSGKVGIYTYVDLGLESGTKWATYNVGASKPTEYGDYFAWGETTPKEDYSWLNYKWGGSNPWGGTSYPTVGRYCDSDSLTTLLTRDDAATANWGTEWRTPTLSEYQELIDGCDWRWTDDFNGSGVAGRIGTSKTNSNTIFLPAAGFRSRTDLDDIDSIGYYWTSSLHASAQSNYTFFLSNRLDWDWCDRNFGQSVRAVVNTNVEPKDITIDSTETAVQGVSVSGKIGNYTYVDLGLPSETKWATYNVGASKPSEYGDYFAWGETTPKGKKNSIDYKWYTTVYTKYCVDSGYGTVDSLTTLLAEDDAATVNWGTRWRMPTEEDFWELQEGCYWEWTSNFNGSGIGGRIGISKTNGHTIFLPAAGDGYGASLDGIDSIGCYWTSSLYNTSDFAFAFSFSVNITTNCLRNIPNSVRAVVN